jgi:hypothetical protein
MQKLWLQNLQNTIPAIILIDANSWSLASDNTFLYFYSWFPLIPDYIWVSTFSNSPSYAPTIIL